MIRTIGPVTGITIGMTAGTRTTGKMERKTKKRRKKIGYIIRDSVKVKSSRTVEVREKAAKAMEKGVKV